MKKSVILCFAAGLVVIAGFQNCGMGPSPQDLADANLTAKSNGGGYDGKLVYNHRSRNQNCGDGSNVVSKVIVENNVYKKVRDNCQDIAAVQMSHDEFDLQTHNLAFATAGTKLYVEDKSTYTGSEILCRGVGKQSEVAGSGIDRIDLWIEDLGINSSESIGELENRRRYVGKMVVGRYNSSGELKEVIHSEGFDVRKNSISHLGRAEVHYLAPNISNERSYILRVLLSDLSAVFHSLAHAMMPLGPPSLSPETLKSPPPIGAPQIVPVPMPSRDMAAMIQSDSLKCATMDDGI